MKLRHDATIYHSDGTIDLTVTVIDKVTKTYTYILTSEYAVEQFMKFYKRYSTHGKAIAVLNKFKEKI